MIRHCVAEDEFVGDGDARCGRTFDDAECNTICPHDPLPPKLSLEELEELTGREPS